MADAKTSEDVLKEIKQIREELAQLREIVHALFTAVFEEEFEEHPEPPSKGRDLDFGMYN